MTSGLPDSEVSSSSPVSREFFVHVIVGWQPILRRSIGAGSFHPSRLRAHVSFGIENHDFLAAGCTVVMPRSHARCESTKTPHCADYREQQRHCEIEIFVNDSTRPKDVRWLRRNGLRECSHARTSIRSAYSKRYYWRAIVTPTSCLSLWPVLLHTVPRVQPMVAALALVCSLTETKERT